MKQFTSYFALALTYAMLGSFVLVLFFDASIAVVIFQTYAICTIIVGGFYMFGEEIAEYLNKKLKRS